MSNLPLFDERFTLERRMIDGVEINVRHGGQGPALLLLHGFPQTHAIWHRVAPLLAPHYTLVMPDLRGYGDSAKPDSDAEHAPYSKRALAADMVGLMHSLGHDRFFLCGHDRGGRVSHRLAVDHPQSVAALIVLDIAPTLTMYERTDMQSASLYYHWFFLIQPAPLPERLIGANPQFFLNWKLDPWQSAGTGFFDPRALAEYRRCFTPATIHAMCEEYRAAASIDLAHDRADGGRRIECPVLALWGERSVVNRLCNPVADWQVKARGRVTGCALPSGHYIPEEVPQLLADQARQFFHGTAA